MVCCVVLVCCGCLQWLTPHVLRVRCLATDSAGAVVLSLVGRRVLLQLHPQGAGLLLRCMCGGVWVGWGGHAETWHAGGQVVSTAVEGGALCLPHDRYSSVFVMQRCILRSLYCLTEVQCCMQACRTLLRACWYYCDSSGAASSQNCWRWLDVACILLCGCALVKQGLRLTCAGHNDAASKLPCCF